MSLRFDLTLPRRHFELRLAADFGKEMIGVFGPSGAGKTSFFNLLAGLARPTGGRIVLNGRVLTDVETGVFVPASKRRIGVVFQEKLLFPHLSVRENLLFGRKYAKDPRISLEAAAELLDLTALLDSRPAAVSGGEQQRTAIGRALLTSPELLLMDEPFNAVDLALRRSILPYLKRLKAELDIPVLVISHDLPDIQRLTDLVYLIENGRSTGFGRIMDLFDGRHGLEDNGLLNTFALTGPERLDDGLYACRMKDAPHLVIKAPCAPEEEFTMVIRPSEISLSRRFVPDISIQNQLPGRIEKIVAEGNRISCIVDSGIRIVAEITPPALKDLALAEGDEVYCLFKTHSLSL